METINITVKLNKEGIPKFQRFLDEHIEVVEFKILPNTDKMYEQDETFRHLSKIKKQSKTAVEKYINDNNNKYNQ